MLRAARGSEAALGELYDRLSGRLLGLALTVLRDRRDAEDAVQDAFVYAWQHAENFDPSRGKALAWLAVIVRHRAIDRLRGMQRRERLIEAVTPEQQALLSEEPGADEIAAQGDSAEGVRAVLNGLPASQREVLLLAYVQGLTQQEIAERVKAPLGTVKTNIRRGLQRLRTVLGSNPGKEVRHD